MKLQDEEKQPGHTRYAYTEKELEDAVENAKKSSYRKAGCDNNSKLQKIPKSTIWNAAKKTYKSHKKGVHKSLSEDDIRSLVTYVHYMSVRGFAFTRKILAAFVVAIIKRSGRPTRMNLEKGPSTKWCRGFMKSYNLSYQSSEQVGKQRLYISREVINCYFHRLRHVVQRLGVDASHMYNMHLTGWSKTQQKVWSILIEYCFFTDDWVMEIIIYSF